MHDDGSNLPWTDEQWACVQSLVQESANRARIANSILPLVGPLPASQASVPVLALRQQAPNPPWYGAANQAGQPVDRNAIDDSITRPLTTIACDVFLRSQQAADPELASARQLLTRAAVIIGRLEDALVFEGQPQRSSPPTRGGQLLVQPPIYTVRGGERFAGLRTAAPAAGQVPVPVPPQRRGAAVVQGYGENLIDGVVAAVQNLEALGQYGPFGCVLGHALYEAAHHPTNFLVMPRDRFVPFLGGGPLLRSSTLPPDEGLIIATADAPIDLVIATDVHVSLLQRTIEPRYALRVSERLTLRVKQPGAIAHLVPAGGPAAPDPAPLNAPGPDEDGGD